MHWRIVPLFMAFVALAHFNRLSITVAGAEKIIPSHTLNEEKMGLVYSAFLLSYTVLMIPGGWFIDRFGPRAGWIIVGLGSAAGALLTGWAGQAFAAPAALLTALLAVRALMGCCNSPLHPTGARLVANWVPPSGAALTNGLLNGAACVGMASVYVLFGALIDGFGWPKAFMVMSGVTLLAALVWVLLGADHPPGTAPSPRPAAEAEAEDGFLRLLADPSLLCLTASYAAIGYFQYLNMYWMQHYFENVLGLDKAVSRRNSAVLVLAMAAGMVVGGWLSDRAQVRFGPRGGLALVPVVGFCFGAVAYFLGIGSTHPTALLVCFAAAMAAVGLGEGSFWTAAVRIGGRRGGTAAAILNTGGNAGGLLAPALTPVLSSWFNWQVGLAVGGFACLLGAALWWGVESPLLMLRRESP
jgi:MFS family permease